MQVEKGFSKLRCDREQSLAIELFTLLKEDKLSDLARDYFDTSRYDVYFNTSSGYVFLCDEEHNVLMKNGKELDLFISTPYAGEEGFMDELIDRWSELDDEDKEHLSSMMSEEQKEEVGIDGD